MDTPIHETENNQLLRISVLTEELQRLEQGLSVYVNQQDDLLMQLQGIQLNIQKYEGLIENARALIEFNNETDTDSDISEVNNRNTNISPSQSLFMDETSDAQPSEYRSRDYSREYTNRRSTLRDTLSQAVYDLLKEREPSPGEPGEPVHYRELVRELQNRGIFISGRDPGLTLIAHIHKDPTFFRPKRGEYGLRDWYPSSKRSVGERSSRRSR